MSRPKNYYVYGDEDYLKRLEDEYTYIGREVKRTKGILVVFALPRRHKKSKVTVKKEEKTEQRSKRERDYGKAR